MRTGYTQDWHITLVYLIRVDTGFVRDLLGRDTMFFLFDVNMENAGVEVLAATLALRGNWEWSQQGEKSPGREDTWGPNVILWVLPIQVLPQGIESVWTKALFWGTGECLSLTSEKTRQIHPLAPSIGERSSEPLACWKESAGGYHWSETHRALQGTMEKLDSFHWIVKMCFWCYSLCLACMKNSPKIFSLILFKEA